MNPIVKGAMFGLALVVASGAPAKFQDAAPVNDVAVQGTNQAFSYEVTTAAPPSAIWALWTDVSSWKLWDKGLRDATADRPLASGVQGEIISLSGTSSRFSITEFSPQNSYTFVTDLPQAKLTIRRIITGANPTRFRHEVSFSGEKGASWAERFGPRFRAALPPTMEALAQLAESYSTDQ